MLIWEKLVNFVHKDVSDESEAKKDAVIMRISLMIMFPYLLGIVFALSYNRCMYCAVATCALLLFYVLFFSMTFKGKEKLAGILLQIVTSIWILMMVILLGWECGVQAFWFSLMVFAIVTGYQSSWYNALTIISFGLMRLCLYYYVMNVTPYYHMSVTWKAFFQTSNTIVVFIQMAFLVITFSREAQEAEKKLTAYNKKIKNLASIDPLTKLINRRAMMEKLNELVNSPERNYFCIAIGDIDFFKKVNDTYGHEAGDAVLVMVADILSKFMEGKGYVARWGGEEFLFVFFSGNGDEVVLELESIRRLIEKTPCRIENREIEVHMTFGLEEFNALKPLDTTISKADEKLYVGKTTGRNKIIF